MSTHELLNTDILIIGSGPSGCVSGTVFAEAGHKVLMVEEGKYLSLADTPHFSCEEMLHKYRNAGVNVALGKQKLAWVEGRCVGGGSEINRGLYHRAPPELFERWTKEYGVDGLTADGMASHFEACENVASVEYVPGAISESSLMLERGAQKNGWNVIQAKRLYRYSANSGEGQKQSMTTTFVKKFHNAGGVLLAETRIERLQRHNGFWYATGTKLSPNGRRQIIEIKSEKVILACGAVQTPALLRRSGIRRNIGNSLHFHPMLKIVAEFDHEINQPGDFDPVHQIKEFEPEFGIGCSIAKPPLLGVALAGQHDHWHAIAERWRQMGIYYIQTTGGRATVRNIPGFSSPLVRINFSSSELGTMYKGLKVLAESMFDAGAVRVTPAIRNYPILDRGTGTKSLPDQFRGEDGSITSVHVFSSCPMGQDQRKTAANSFGKVHDTDGLYVFDASLLCTPTIVNPQGTVMAIAHRNAIDALERNFS